MMKIVILDGFTENPGDLSWEGIAKLGELTVYDRTNAADIIPRIGDAEIIFTNKTPITRETLEACPNIRYIGVLATGYNIVDVQAAAEKGITVTNVPAYGTFAVAQAAFALLLEITNRVGHHSDTVFRGKWTQSPDFCYWDHSLMSIHGKTMGLIGFGRIGKAAADIAKAFGMNVIYCTSKEGSLDDVLKNSDVISLHCPLTQENEKLINRDTIAKMKDGVIIINTARGQLIDEQALCDALNSGKVFAAGLDVVSKEPIDAQNPLLKAKNCFITPHIAWAAKESRQKLMDIAVDNLKSFLAGNIKNRVN